MKEPVVGTYAKRRLAPIGLALRLLREAGDEGFQRRNRGMY